jgi:hypothetical protein
MSGTKKPSRKSQVKQLFEEHDVETAWTRGLALGLSPNTLRVWFSLWRHKEIEGNLKPLANA